MGDPDIKDVTEALKWLNLLVERGKNIDAAIAFVEPKEPGLLASAMIKGVRAAVIQYESWLNGGYAESELEGEGALLVTLARAYRPAMVELGWVPE